MKRFQFNSPVILGFFLISLSALLLGTITNGTATMAVFSVYRAPLIDPLTYVRFIGHIFGHANMAHFFNNMLLLLVIGPPLEELYGSRNLLIAILSTALISGLLQFILFPDSALLGASGIVFMLIMLSSLSGAKTGRIPITLILVAVMYLGQELYAIFFIQDNVANLMHIVGGVCGIGFGALLKRGKL